MQPEAPAVCPLPGGQQPAAQPAAALLPDVRDRLLEAGPAAVQFLVDALFNEKLSYKERIDIAKDLLNRGFGKTLLPDQPEPAPVQSGLRIEISPEAAAYAE